MNFIDSFKNTVKKTTKDVVKVSSDAVEFTKLKIKIAEINDKINAEFRNIGELVYNTSIGDESDSDLIEEKFDIISSMKSQLEELEEQMIVVTNKKICNNCGTKNSSKSVYCLKCGKKFDDTIDD